MHKEKIGAGAGVAVYVGSIVGSGILIAPAIIAGFSQSLFVSMILWSLGGLLCIAGSIIYGQLGLLFPLGGGQYIYLEKTLGRRYSFIYGWLSFLVIGPTMIAGAALFLAGQFDFLFPRLSIYGTRLIALVSVLLLTALNCQGIRWAGLLQKVIVIVQIAMLFALIGASFYLLKGFDTASLWYWPHWPSLSFTQGLAAFSMVLWSYEGFNTLTFITDEVEEGERKIKQIAVVGCAIVLILYFLFNAAVLLRVDRVDLLKTSNAAISLARLCFGPWSEIFVFIVTCIGVASVIHTSIIIGPRIIKAMADAGQIGSYFRELDPVHSSPTRALWIQALVVSGYIGIGRFEGLVQCFIVVNWIFYGLTAWGYLKIAGTGLADRATAWFFMVLAGLLIASQFVSTPGYALAGCALLGAALGISRNRKWL